MYNFKDLVYYAKICIALEPEEQENIKDLVEMARDEIQDGGSEEHECELARDSIKELLIGIRK